MVEFLNLDKRIKITQALDAIILSVLILAFLGYSIYFRAFAELHIKLSFLNFPIFMGELLLFICLALTICKWFLIRRKFKINCILLFGVYLIFIFLKIVFGYPKFGSFALRHAAIFYYPIFALIAYEVQPQLKKTSINILIISFLVYFILDVALYYLFIYLVLMVIFIVKSRNKALKILTACVLLAFFPYKQLFISGARTRVIGHMAGLATIFILWFLSSRLKLKYKLLILILSITLFTIGFVKMLYLPRFQSLLNPNGLFTEMKKWDKLIEENRKSQNLRTDIKIKLYNPEKEEDIPVTKIIAKINEDRALNQDYSKFKAIALSMKTGSTKVSQDASFRKLDITAKKQESNVVEKQDTSQNTGALYNTSICRLLIWRDMLKELIRGRRFFGFDFGKPLLPESIQLTDMAASEWKRDGWIAAHNSFLEIIYRSGIIGILLIISLFVSVVGMARIFIISRSFLGICAIGILTYWLGVTLTYVTFEMPYSAITFWSIFGFTLAYAYKNESNQENY